MTAAAIDGAWRGCERTNKPSMVMVGRQCKVGLAFATCTQARQRTCSAGKVMARWHLVDEKAKSPEDQAAAGGRAVRPTRQEKSLSHVLSLHVLMSTTL